MVADNASSAAAAVGEVPQAIVASSIAPSSPLAAVTPARSPNDSEVTSLISSSRDSTAASHTALSTVSSDGSGYTYTVIV